MATFRHDVLIIGSGAAGLTTALRLPDDCRIALLSKGELTSASTYYAQGGVAAVLDQEDSLESHVADTHVAGGGLCHDDAVRYTVENGPDAIRWLIDLGVDFTRLTGDNDSALPYHLTREGGHSHRRIIHAADATGKAISGTLIGQVRKKDNVTRFEYRVAVDLILQEHNGPNGQKGKEKRCCGAYVHNIETGETDVILARAVVLATGGASKVYLYTSNPDVATGDGIAMAWRAGWPTWNSCSPPPPACTTPRPKVFWSPRPFAAKVGTCCCPAVSASCIALMNAENWPPGTWWPAPSTMK